MKNPKGFSLMELVLVIIIMTVLVSMSKNLFQTPNKYILESEVCINNINGKISQFFYQGITGKNKTISGTTYEPTQYVISMSRDITGNSSKLDLDIFTGSAFHYRDTSVYINPTSTTSKSNILWCDTSVYTVVLSGADINTIDTGNIAVLLTKNLNNADGSAGMSICKNYDLNNTASCNKIFTSRIDFLVCKKDLTTNILDMSSCKHTFSSRFDTTTQSLKFNRCLNILYNTACTKWSIDDF